MVPVLRPVLLNVPAEFSPEIWIPVNPGNMNTLEKLIKKIFVY